jgi:hypothetical protein
MWVLLCVLVPTPLLIDDNQSVWVCPKIVEDTNVTVVADVTVGCYRMYF